ncbi:MAG: type II toxin-antitoxin system VapC family toxin [Candidatus Bathyarchaeia archaeon]
MGEAILRSPRVRVINVTDDLFKGAWEAFKRHSEIPMSFTDATTIEAMRAHEIGLIMSFDEDFDRVPEFAKVYEQSE